MILEGTIEDAILICCTHAYHTDQAPGDLMAMLGATIAMASMARLNLVQIG
jgi:hypothetical protein